MVFPNIDHLRVEVTGIDGAGKSTLVSSLGKTFGLTVRKVRPFTPEVLAAESQIRASLGRDAAEAYRSAALGAALLEEASSIPDYAVFDRYIESARMWWIVRGQVGPPDRVLETLPQPDLILFLSVPTEVGLSRRLSTSEHSGKEEKQFLKGAAEYLEQRSTTSAKWIRIDGEASESEVFRTASSVLQATATRLSGRDRSPGEPG